MRPGDAALPAPFVPHVPGPDAPIAGWPFELRVALEQLTQAAYTWDDADDAAVWDAVDADAYVWDAPFIGGGFTDAVCDFVTLDIAAAEPDELALFGPTEVTLTLANDHGAYTPWTADGRLVYWAPGRRLNIWTTQGGTDDWLFAGRVAAWQVNVDDTVTVTAYDALAELAQDVAGPEWTPGAAGQRPRDRITQVLAQAAVLWPVTGDLGDVPLTTELTDDSPLEHVQRVALSDGGLVYADVDGAVTYRNRVWRAGRDDQGETVVITDNVCTVPVVVWDAELAADDDALATTVRLVNLAGLAATAALPDTGDPWAGTGRYVLTHPDPDYWTSQADGNALAAYLLAQQSTPAMAVRQFSMYVLDPTQPKLPGFALGLRRGDRVEFLHDFTDANGDPATLDTFAIAMAVSHAVTPEEWVTIVNLSRTVDWRTIEQWDRSRFTWDDPNDLNVWRY